MTNSAKHHIYLIGPRGCGKTTVGQLLAERLSWDWIDLDQVIQEHAGQTIAEIFANQGQAAFRDLESELLLKQSDGPQKVISLGGGAVLRPENQSTVQRTGFTVFLNADAETLVARIASDPNSAETRPSLLPESDPSRAGNTKDRSLRILEEMQQVLALRMPVYQQTSDLQLDTTHLSAREIVDQLCRWLPRVDRRFADFLPSTKAITKTSATHITTTKNAGTHNTTEKKS